MTSFCGMFPVAPSRTLSNGDEGISPSPIERMVVGARRWEDPHTAAARSWLMPPARSMLRRFPLWLFVRIVAFGLRTNDGSIRLVGEGASSCVSFVSYALTFASSPPTAVLAGLRCSLTSPQYGISRRWT